jgi:hypothetical protein
MNRPPIHEIIAEVDRVLGMSEQGDKLRQSFTREQARAEEARAREASERAQDLEFIEELRTASTFRLEQIQRNLDFGGPEWMIVAVERALRRRAMLTS